MKTRALIIGIAMLLATGAAHATERYLVRCAGQVFTVYGHHGYMFFRGEPANNDEQKELPDRWFRFRGHDLLFRGHKCKYLKDLLHDDAALN